MKRVVLLVGLCACGSFGSSRIEPDGGAIDAGPDATTIVDGASGATDASDGGASNNKLVFVTKAGVTSGSGSDFAPAADALCNTEAASAGRSGRTFVAWVSTDVVDAIARIPGNGPWAVPAENGNPTTTERVVFANREGLFNAELASPIDRHADGLASPPSFVWTGTGANGTKASTCVGWTATSDQSRGTVGSSGAMTAEWTETSTQQTCDAMRPVLCFER